MKVFIEREEKELEIKFSGTVKELMKKLNLNPEVFIVSKNGEVVTEDELLDDKDKIDFLSVVSGG